MRRLAHVEVPLPRVREIFHDLGSWPSWMPDFTACHVLGRTSQGLRARVSQKVFGQPWQQTVDFRPAETGVDVRALDGLLKWRARWGFQEPPDGAGTTVSLDLETETGLLGLASRGLFDRVNHRRFDATVAALARRARQLAAPEAVPEAAAEGRRLLVVYETSDGFEVWYAGRRYVTRKRAG